MTSEELEPYISTLKKVGLCHKIHILSFLQVELKLKLKNPSLDEELVEHVNQAVTKEFKKLDTKDKKIQVLAAYNTISVYNSTLGDFYLNELFLNKDPYLLTTKGYWVNKWYINNMPLQGVAKT